MKRHFDQLFCWIRRVLANYLQPVEIWAHRVLMDNRKHRLNDIERKDQRTYGHLRAEDPQMPDFVWRTLLRYRPNTSKKQWDAVREFVLTIAVAMRPRSHGNARRLMTIAGRFACWRWAVTGMDPLTTDRVFTNGAIHLYVHEQLPKHSDAYRWSVVRQLGVIAEALTDNQVKRLPSANRPATWRPFTTNELATIHSWSGTRPTLKSRRNAWAILGLAAGAGLRGEEVAATRIGDIDIIDGRMWVSVHLSKARRVPVMRPWNRVLLRSIEGRSHPQELLFQAHQAEECPSRGIQSFLSSNPCPVRPTVSSLRATWMVAHLNNQVPVSVLLEVSGCTSPASFAPYMKYVAPLPLDTFVGLLVGEELR